MSKKKIYGNCKAQSRQMQQVPKFLQTAFPESPSNKCLTHILGVDKDARSAQELENECADAQDGALQLVGKCS